LKKNLKLENENETKFKFEIEERKDTVEEDKNLS